MAEVNDLIKALDDILDDEILAGLVENFTGILGPLLDEIELILKDLSLDNQGNVKPTTGNLKIINKAKTKLINALSGQEYNAAIDQAAGGFYKAVETMDAYMTVLSGGFEPTAKMRALIEVSVTSMTDQLAGTRLGAAFAAQVGGTLNNAITMGLPFRQLMQGIKEELRAEALMGVTRFNIKQTITDAFGVMSGAYMKEAGTQAGVNWWRYGGGKIKTTRPWCRERDGHFFHEKEIRTWGNETWAGQMEGTTPQNIFSTRGGYNCRHNFFPVDERIVPDGDKMRFKSLNI